MMGLATIAPTQPKRFRIIMARAIPLVDLLGMNSVSIVEVMAKMSIDPMPKKKVATIYVPYVSFKLLRQDVGGDMIKGAPYRSESENSSVYCPSIPE